MLDLFFLKHLDAALEFSVSAPSSLIGRSSNCDFQIDKDSLSREHARIAITKDGLTLEDLHSTNGTFVNERQIFEKTAIKPGDILRFGQEEFSIQRKDSETTLVFDQNSLARLNAASSMLVADEEEGEEGTMMLQSIALPADWQQGGVNISLDGELSDKDRELLNALREHAKRKLSHTHGLLTTILPEGRPPMVKMLSSDKDEAVWTLGRGSEQSLVLEDQRVSTHHADIQFKKGKWLFVDNDSKNGSFLNSKRISEKEIVGSLTLEVGPFMLQFDTVEKPKDKKKKR